MHEQASAKARSMLRDLETAKLGGQDYPLPALAELRLVSKLLHRSTAVHLHMYPCMCICARSGARIGATAYAHTSSTTSP